MSRSHTLIVGAFLAALGSRETAAQDADTDLAKASQNPVSSMVSLPFQNNLNFGTGVPGRTQYILNFQPVVPMEMSSDLLLVPRLILPTVNQPLGPNDSRLGLGDATLQLFFATEAEGLTIGAGPAFIFPTATDPLLGAERWSTGAAVVMLVMPGRWVAGFLAMQQWSYAGDSDRASVAPFSLQPFVNYNLDKGWAINSSPILTADWMAGDDAWIVPLGGGLSRTFKAGPQAMTLGAQAFANVVHPDGAPDWNLRITFSLLFPH